MKRVCCVYEDNHGMIGVAKDYPSAIDGLFEEDWLDGNTELVDEDGNFFTVEGKIGEEWLDKIKKWDIATFNIFFEGYFWIDTMEIWGS
jgi:hypothetical protein